MAYDALSKGLQQASRSLVAIPVNEYQKHGISSAIKTTVFQALPHAIIRPIIGGTDALKKALQGLKTQVQMKKGEYDKFKN